MSNGSHGHDPTGKIRPYGTTRRRMLWHLTGISAAGCFLMAALRQRGWIGAAEPEEDAESPDALSGATKKFNWAQLKDLKGKLPKAKIGDFHLSRMFLGGNLIGGWAHARDLLYLEKLVKAYHTREKVFETFRLAEACGINAFLANPGLGEIVKDYWESCGGKIQFISNCGGNVGELMKLTQKSIDDGAAACYLHGGAADALVEAGNFDPIEKVLDLIRKNGLPAGIGAHRIETVKACVERGLTPDFWMKTLHTHDYWSARPEEPQHDNNWCLHPRETIQYMSQLPQPWIAFKVLAAGALRPEVGFRHAFASGADFICVGIYDFQMVEDVNIALDVLNSDLKRQRPWRAETV